MTTSTPPSLLPSKLRALSSSPDLSAATSLRDPAWEQQEKSYHEAALKEINDLVRRYNGIAPYSVRRSYHDMAQELKRCYDRCGEAVVRELEERVKAFSKEAKGRGMTDESEEGLREGGPQVPVIRVRDVIRGWMQSLAARFGPRTGQ
jgi:DnaJ homolog subfamily C member 28